MTDILNTLVADTDNNGVCTRTGGCNTSATLAATSDTINLEGGLQPPIPSS